jgi:hypothetical protein
MLPHSIPLLSWLVAVVRNTKKYWSEMLGLVLCGLPQLIFLLPLSDVGLVLSRVLLL